MESADAIISPYSTCCAYLVSLFGADKLGAASGFFWRHDQDIYLISNWHVFSGRSPRTGQPIDSKNGVVPNMLMVKCIPKSNLNKEVILKLPLEEDGNPNWVQHRTYGQKVDLAALNISQFMNRHREIWSSPLPINEIPDAEQMTTDAGSDVFILGYPLGITKTGLFPVWKRASIATEFDLSVDCLPSFLVDTATREGMSGSPVIIRSFGGYTRKGGSVTVSHEVFSEFIGVYSGRHVGGIDEAQLGIIWKKVLIPEILNDPAPGSFELFS